MVVQAAKIIKMCTTTTAIATFIAQENEQESPKGEQQLSESDDLSVPDPPRPLTTAEKNTIATVFQDVIQSDQKVLLDTIRFELRESVQLRNLLLIKGMYQKVADRVRRCQVAQRMNETTQQT